jgi:hypothetical protein
MRLPLFAMVLIASTGAAQGPLQTIPDVAEVTYRGTYSVVSAKKTRQSTRVDLNRLLGDALKSQGGTRYEGALTLEMKFDGPAVTAKLSGTGGVTPITLSGLVRDGVCRLTDPKNLEVYEGRCSATSFVGTVKDTELSRNSLKGTFDLAVVNIVDVGERNARQAAEREAQAAAAAEKKKIIDARRAELRKLCDAGKFTACVEMDTLE